ncbi:hypothetical protein T4B_2328 [Trichinella pseudospiralis]|uniref:Uncharacterized protein n=2 Tax=Trichinella pseudospiralis TaxID=6337 RepID=A0A0V1FHE0_TRIPS|nr:hypothetical protein T4A_7198 [Trichinella pseudospiralis]KRY85390.1 hypothetical protein T4D_5945 [Trichinella pseudospiralis]KRZ33105.1 hypothetical protein T4B_2328 [Trichinella pseudospiralis]
MISTFSLFAPLINIFQRIGTFNIMLAIYISLALANLQNLSWFLLANAPYQDISAVRLTVESDGCALQ